MRTKLGYVIMDKQRHDFLATFRAGTFTTSRVFCGSPELAMLFTSRKAAYLAIAESQANALVMTLYDGGNHYDIAY